MIWGSEDRLAVAELMAKFATGIDSCDWAMYRAVFTDEIDLDYSSWRPESIGRWNADDWVARGQRVFPGLTASRHALTNLLVIPEGGGCRVRANVCADHVLVAGEHSIRVFTLNGHYDDRCVRADDGWKIAAKRLVVEWCVGDREVLAIAAERVAAGAANLRGAT